MGVNHSDTGGFQRKHVLTMFRIKRTPDDFISGYVLDYRSHRINRSVLLVAAFSGYIRHKSFGILLFIFRFIIKGKRLLHNLTEGIKNVNIYFLLVCAK